MYLAFYFKTKNVEVRKKFSESTFGRDVMEVLHCDTIAIIYFKHLTLVNSIKFSEQFKYLIIYRAGHHSSCDTSPQYKFSTALTATELFWN